MPDLAHTPPFAGLELPLTVGQATLAPLPETTLFSIAPFRGRAPAVAEALGVLPAAGESAALGEGRVLWAGLDLWLVEGPAAATLAEAAGHAGAAITDQSDAWAGLALTGPATRDVLARLVPIDTDPVAFPAGATARSLLQHLACLLVATGGGVEILVPRSCARTAAHDLVEAMSSVAATAALRAAEGGAGA